MSNNNPLRSSIGRKIIMSITGLFLVVFLLVHLGVNLTLFFGKETFEKASHFMGENPIIQLMQYVLALGFIVHIIMGIKLEIQNRKARPKGYVKEKKSANSSFASRNMIYTGLLILLFLVIHLKDYFVPIKFEGNLEHYELVVSLFKNEIYVLLYVISFIFLSIHLSHGVKSSFQSLGARHSKYTAIIERISILIFWFIGLGFSSISIYFYFN